MLIFKLSTILIAVILAAFLITQIVIPAFSGQKLFWVFRGTKINMLRMAKGRLKEEKVQQAIDEINKQINKIQENKK